MRALLSIAYWLFIAIATLAVVAVLALATFGCGPRPARKVDLHNDSDETMWCVAGRSDKGEALLACAYTEKSCARMRSSALRWGGMAHVAEVGACEWRDIGASP